MEEKAETLVKWAFQLFCWKQGLKNVTKRIVTLSKMYYNVSEMEYIGKGENYEICTTDKEQREN
jgi:hypothetical protein